MLPASFLVTIALIILTSIAVTLAIKFELTTSLFLSFIIFVGGLLSDYMILKPSKGINIVGFIFNGIIPNWQHFWLADALDNGSVIPFGYIIKTIIYSLCYLAFVLFSGIIIFKHVDLK